MEIGSKNLACGAAGHVTKPSRVDYLRHRLKKIGTKKSKGKFLLNVCQGSQKLLQIMRGPQFKKLRVQKSWIPLYSQSTYKYNLFRLKA